MKRLLSSGWTVLLVGGVVALAAVSFFAPGRRHIALDVFVLFLGGLGLAAGVRATRPRSRLMPFGRPDNPAITVCPEGRIVSGFGATWP